MYELDYKPVRLSDFNDYFVFYKDTHDVKHYREFLHFYEPVLNRRVRRFIEQYELDNYRAEDLKQIFASVLWEELQNYESKLPLLLLIKYKVKNAWYEYVQTNCGNFLPDNNNQYRLLRKIAFLYYQKSADNKSFDDIITEITNEMKLTEGSVRNLINAVVTFKPKYNAVFYGSDDEDSEFYADIAGDLATEELFFIGYRRELLSNALNALPKKDRLIIEDVFGICPDCLRNKERKTLREVSLRFGLTENGAEKKLKTILKKLRKALQE